MNERETKAATIFQDGEEFGGVVISALTMPKVAELIRRGNPMFAGQPDEDGDTDGKARDRGAPITTAEVFFVLAHTPAELAKMFRLSDDDWDERVVLFLHEHADATKEFSAALVREMSALGAVAAVPVSTGKQDREAPSEQAAQSPAGVLP